jgi:hypothetical protein
MISGSSDFSITGKTCGATVAAGGSCSITIVFNPSAKGALDGELLIEDNGSNSPQVVQLDGNGEWPLRFAKLRMGSKANSLVSSH